MYILASKRRVLRFRNASNKILAGRSLPAGIEMELKRAEDYCERKKPRREVVDLIQYCISLFRHEISVDLGSSGVILSKLLCVVRNFMFNLSKPGHEEIILFHGGLASPILRQYKAIEYALEAYEGRIWIATKKLIGGKSGLIILKDGVKLKVDDTTWQ